MYPIKKITLEHAAYVLVRLTERDSVDWKVNPLEGPYILPKKLGFRASIRFGWGFFFWTGETHFEVSARSDLI